MTDNTKESTEKLKLLTHVTVSLRKPLCCLLYWLIDAALFETLHFFAN